MITLQHLNDLDLINRLILDAAVNDDISDDASKNHEIQQLPHTFECLGIYQDEEIKGLFMLVPQNAVTVEIHTCLLLRGKEAFQAGQLLLDYLFSKYQKAISYTPSTNKKALFYALRLGFKKEGVLTQSFLKNGELLDQTLVGLTKGEYLCQLQQR